MKKMKNWIKKPLAVMAVLGLCLGMALAACSDDDGHATSKLTHKTGNVVLAVADTEHLAK
jgi:hypothetical protein